MLARIGAAVGPQLVFLASTVVFLILFIPKYDTKQFERGCIKSLNGNNNWSQHKKKRSILMLYKMRLCSLQSKNTEFSMKTSLHCCFHHFGTGTLEKAYELTNYRTSERGVSASPPVIT